MVENQALSELETLLNDMFDAASLRVLVQRFDRRVAGEVDFTTLSAAASGVVNALFQHGQFAAPFFEALIAARPMRKEEIGAVASRFGVSLVPWFQQTKADWTQTAFRELRETLVLAYARPDDAQRIAKQLGIASPSAQVSQFRAWELVIDAAASSKKLPELIEVVLAEQINAPLRNRLTALRGAATPGISDGAFKWKLDIGTTEALMNERSTLLDVVFLERGAIAAQSVVQLNMTFARGSAKGSGFLISADRVLTNHHVLHDWDGGGAPATEVVVRLNFQHTASGGLAEVVEIPGVVKTIRGDRNFDWAIIDLETSAPDRFPALSLAPPPPMPKLGDTLSIIQHPLGLEKKVAVSNNTIAFVDENVIQYLTDTEVGSSGAPVFNDRWQVVALHHRGGRLTIPGTTQSAWRNQGIRIDRVIDGLRAGKP